MNEAILFILKLLSKLIVISNNSTASNNNCIELKLTTFTHQVMTQCKFILQQLEADKQQLAISKCHCNIM